MYRLSFGQISLVTDKIAELVIDSGVEITLEMCEEMDEFLLDHFPGKFAIINNRIQDYSLTYEAILQMGSLEHFVAAAIITYRDKEHLYYEDMLSARPQDNLNVKVFSGLQLGRASAIDWLTEQIHEAEVSD